MISDKNYKMVTLEQIQEVLRPEKNWFLRTEHWSNEYFLDFHIRKAPQIRIRVATSVLTDSNTSRGRGRDAIRVYAFDAKNNRGYIGTKRVYRIGTWRKNLEKAVWDCFKKANERLEREGVR